MTKQPSQLYWALDAAWAGAFATPLSGRYYSLLNIPQTMPTLSINPDVTSPVNHSVSRPPNRRCAWLAFNLLAFFVFANANSCVCASQWFDYRGEIAAKTECEPWLLEVERKIVSEKSYKQTERTLLHFLDERQPLFCSFSVSESGEIENLKVDPSSEKKFQSKSYFPEVSREVLELARVASPLPTPPNSIVGADESGVVLRFERAVDKILVVSVQVGRSNKPSRIGQVGSADDIPDPQPIVRYKNYPWVKSTPFNATHDLFDADAKLESRPVRPR